MEETGYSSYYNTSENIKHMTNISCKAVIR